SFPRRSAHAPTQNSLGFPRATRQKARVSFLRRPLALMIPLLALSLTLSGSSPAQLDGTDRGIDPYDSASNFEVGGVQVDVRAASGDAARSEGWRRAQILGWRILWARTHNRPIEQAPDLPESTLSGIVSGIVIE